MRRRMALSERMSFERRTRERDWPLPTRGWFGDAEGAEIDPAYAVRLQNLWWRGAKLRQRPGYDLFNEQVGKQRITHALGGAGSQVIAIFPSYMQVGASSVARTSAGRMMDASISAHTIMVDGGGPIMRFNGTVIDQPVFTASGIDVSTLDGVLAHHDRLYFWKSGGPLEFWYGGLGAVEGVLTKFPLGRLGNMRGGISAMGRYTSDAGYNVNDLLVIFTTEGDVAIYEGLDPGLTTDWRLWGRLKLAAPISRFALLNYAADLMVLTTQGIASIGAAMNRGESSLTQSMSAPIRQELADAIAADPESDRWQMIADPAQQFVIVSAPQDRAFVFGTDGVRWYEWTDIPAMSWRRDGASIYFTATSGREMRFGGTSGDLGAPIRSTWWSMQTRSIGPHVATVRPRIRCVGPLALDVLVLADGAATVRDIAEVSQTVTIYPENESDSAAQTLSEHVMVGITGDVMQLRMSFAAIEAEIAAVRWA